MSKVHQELLKRVTLSLGIQVEEKEFSHYLVDILATAGPFRMVLPLNGAIMDPVKRLWQTSTTLPPTSKRAECKYCVPTQGWVFLYSLVVSAAKKRER